MGAILGEIKEKNEERVMKMFIVYFFIGGTTLDQDIQYTVHNMTTQQRQWSVAPTASDPSGGQMDASSCCKKAPVRTGGALLQNPLHNFLRTVAGGAQGTED